MIMIKIVRITARTTISKLWNTAKKPNNPLNDMMNVLVVVFLNNHNNYNFNLNLF